MGTWSIPAFAVHSLGHPWSSGDCHGGIAAFEAQSPGADQAASCIGSWGPLASVSTWADEHRNPKTAPRHYVNFPRGNCSFEPERDCPEGQCVVRAIDEQVKVLKSGAEDELKLKALKYLVHFVGDVHQPLHAGYGDDRGATSTSCRLS